MMDDARYNIWVDADRVEVGSPGANLYKVSITVMIPAESITEAIGAVVEAVGPLVDG